MTAAAPKDFNRIRAAFMQRASAPKVPHAAFKLGWLIAYRYMNRESGTARPAQETLARDLNVSVRTVQRLIDMLQPLGLVVVPGHGPNRASTYWLEQEKTTPLSPINTTPVSPIDGRIGDNRRQNRRQPVHEKATPVSPQPYKKNQEEEPRVESGLRAPGRCAEKKWSPAKEIRGEAGGPIRDRGRRNVRKILGGLPQARRKGGGAPGIRSSGRERNRSRSHDRGRRSAGGHSCRRRSRYTPNADRWIREKRWQDEPPDGAVIDEHGNVVAVERPRRSEPQTMFELAEEMYGPDDDDEVRRGHFH